MTAALCIVASVSNLMSSPKRLPYTVAINCATSGHATTYTSDSIERAQSDHHPDPTHPCVARTAGSTPASPPAGACVT